MKNNPYPEIVIGGAAISSQHIVLFSLVDGY